MRRYLIIVLKIVFIPVSVVYGLVMEIRNRLYEWGIFKSYVYQAPVIAVGNLTVGGTGKTPLTIFIAQYFSKKYQVAVISRGYGRASKGVQIVSDGKNILRKPADTGDEPWLIAKSVSKSIVIVAEKRQDALQVLQSKFKPDLVILDDAFQHRSVKRDLDILLINNKEPHFFNLTLPSGRYREFPHNKQRADILIYTNVDADNSVDKDNIFHCSTGAGDIINIDFQIAGSISRLNGKKVTAFCGIANPNSFYDLLDNNGIIINEFFSFRDHRRYSKSDWQNIARRARKNGSKAIICTEKDLVKVKSIIKNVEVLKKLFAVRLNLKIMNEQKFYKRLDELIDN